MRLRAGDKHRSNNMEVKKIHVLSISIKLNRRRKIGSERLAMASNDACLLFLFLTYIP